MQSITQDNALTKAKTLAVLMKIAPYGTPVDFKADSASELWKAGASEELLYDLDQEGAITFEAPGDGDHLLICYTKKVETPTHLLLYLESAAEQLRVANQSLQEDLDRTKSTLAEIYQHNPEALKQKIQSSREHIRKARKSIVENEVLATLAAPLDEIQRHFDSLAVVADNYSSVYSNVLKPIEEEGKKGVKATVRWALAGIFVSVLIANFKTVKDIFVGVAI